MSIERIELSLLKMPYVHYFETSFSREYDRTFIIVKVFEEGVVGYGEVVATASPLYSCETTTTAWHVLKDFFIPLTLKMAISDPVDYHREMGMYRGHPMARAGLELALWDLKAKKKGQPLYKIYGGIKEGITAGVSVGIQDTVPELLNRIHAFLEEGYQRIKIKIKPGWDGNICREIRKEFPDILLQVDANGAYGIEDAEHLKELDGYGLLMLEQPFPPYDLWDHSRLQKLIKTPVCLDESILSLITVRQALEMGSCRIVNIKVGRIGGIVEARKIHDFCQDKKIPVWCGGMLESGIGRAHNVHLASLPNFLFPNDISASKRYYKQDLIDPAFDIEPDGTIKIPRDPGIGVKPVETRIQEATLKREIFRNH